MHQFFLSVACRMHRRHSIAGVQVLQRWEQSYKEGPVKPVVATHLRLRTRMNGTVTFAFMANHGMWEAGTRLGGLPFSLPPLALVEDRALRSLPYFCDPAATDIVVANLGLVHAAYLERPYLLSAPNVAKAVERVARTFWRARVFLHGTVWPMERTAFLRHFRMSRLAAKELPPFYTNASHPLFGDVQQHERGAARLHGADYLDNTILRGTSFTAVAYTDQVHMCQPGLPDLLADVWSQRTCLTAVPPHPPPPIISQRMVQHESSAPRLVYTKAGHLIEMLAAALLVLALVCVVLPFVLAVLPPCGRLMFNWFRKGRLPWQHSTYTSF